MIQYLDSFSKRPIKAKIYSGKEFIKDVFPGFQGDEIELGVDVEEDEETGEEEENYDLYFPGVDSL
ncbi:hypothetical protein OCK74_04230 [Chitinophagaceae bacterium LB-8]|uniref:Uncharacterized protein n=1 Tax=Paraflavisolibacter caeni TaxID=2982496 RepID=A0A9X2XSV0_9BACT|nr:hypothetical protein [Paraflavisolibacter caeni]MCU7548306.1 hypothetical protein [Paraflavisolibacter caeni]